MGVYIKGREMPNNCQECVCINDEYFYCQAVGRQPQDENVISQRPDWCPLVEVPPHGRLGDLDELYNHLNEWYLTHEHGFSETEKIYIRAMLSGVEDSPTVIPASEEE